MIHFFTHLAAYVAAIIAVVVLDLLWLGLIAKNMYASALGRLLKDSPYLPPAVAFYLLYSLGVVYFAAAPALASGSWLHAAGRGAALGFFAYMTYEFTNLALIRGWPASLVGVDIIWGAALTGAAASAAYFAAKVAAKALG